MTPGMARLQVLALEAYVSSSERLKQLLIEVHRWLKDRQETAHRLSHSSCQQAGPQQAFCKCVALNLSITLPRRLCVTSNVHTIKYNQAWP